MQTRDLDPAIFLHGFGYMDPKKDWIYFSSIIVFKITIELTYILNLNPFTIIIHFQTYFIILKNIKDFYMFMVKLSNSNPFQDKSKAFQKG